MLNRTTKEILGDNLDNLIHGEMDYIQLPENIKLALYERYLEDMPYGTAKARTGDPDQWIYNKICDTYGSS